MAFIVLPGRYGASSNKARYSADGITWTYATIPYASASSYTMCSVGCINGIFVASRDLSNVGFYSTTVPTDSWSTVTLPYNVLTQQNAGCEFMGRLYYTSGSNFAYTTNGSSWTTGALPNASGKLTAASPTRIVCASGTNIAYSTDGTNWSIGASTPTAAWAIMWNGTYFVAVNSTVSGFYYSTDATSWTTGPTWAAFSSTWGMDANPNTGRICLTNGNPNTVTRYTDNLGSTWSNSNSVASKLWRDIRYDTSLNLFVTYAYKTADTLTSPDGATWTSRTGYSDGNENYAIISTRNYATAPSYNASQFFSVM